MATMGRKPYLDMSFLEDQYVQKWLTGLSKVTKKSYSYGIKEWFDFTDMTPSEQIKLRIKQTVSMDMNERTHFETLWRKYREFLEQKGDISDATIKSNLKIVASFFSRNSLPLKLKRGDWTLTTTQKVKQKQWVLTNQEIRKLYSHANLRDRALLLTLYQSGFSEVDVSNIMIEDMTGLYETPVGEHYFIRKNREKTGCEQATCLSLECVHDLKAMLQERNNPTEGYLFVSTTNKKGTKISVRTINDAMKGLVIKAFGEKKADQFKTKSLRSSYNSALLRANVQPQEIKDVMLGHKRQGARSHYAFDEITIKERYNQVFQFLCINGIQNKKDIEDLRKAQLANAKLLTQLNQENQELKEKMKKIEESNATKFATIIKVMKKQGLLKKED